jgi:hypothetical protein
MSDGLAFCLAEDRAEGETGLRLAILSLAKHCPGTPIYVYKPASASSFGDWVRQFSQVNWIPSTPVGAHSWNCKPQALKPLLANGHRDAVWVDSDIIVTKDIRPLFEKLDPRVLVITQEPASLHYQGTALRTKAWNLEVGRSLPFTLNSSVLRVTNHHLALLDVWAKYLSDPQYVSYQSKSLEERPIHMASDQDVLNALVGAREFADIPLHVIPSGSEIIHTGGALGYSWKERLRGVFLAKPAFLHATAGKPWLWLGGEPYWSKRNFFGWYRRLLQETSPYLFESRHFRKQLDQDSQWMDRRTGTGSILRFLGFGHFALRGLPLAAAASAIESFKRMSRAVRRLGVSKPPDEGVPLFGRRQ